MPAPRPKFSHLRARLRREANGLTLLDMLATGPRVAAQLHPEGRLWCLQSGLATRFGSTWRITDKGREVLRRQSAERTRFSATGGAR